MLVKQFKPNLNYVLLKRTHEMEAILLRAKDPAIPNPFHVEVIAIGPNVQKNIEIGDEVYLSPHPYDSFYIEFEDNELSIFKVKDSIMAQTTGTNGLIISGSATTKVLPKPGEKIKFITYLMVKDGDVIATISPLNSDISNPS